MPIENFELKIEEVPVKEPMNKYLKWGLVAFAGFLSMAVVQGIYADSPYIPFSKFPRKNLSYEG